MQIDVSKHITVDTTAGQVSGAGIGIDWKLDDYNHKMVIAAARSGIRR